MIKQEALIKLATVRLAINHVIRQRMLKQAGPPDSVLPALLEDIQRKRESAKARALGRTGGSAVRPRFLEPWMTLRNTVKNNVAPHMRPHGIPSSVSPTHVKPTSQDIPSQATPTIDYLPPLPAGTWNLGFGR